MVILYYFFVSHRIFEVRQIIVKFSLISQKMIDFQPPPFKKSLPTHHSHRQCQREYHEKKNFKSMKINKFFSLSPSHFTKFHSLSSINFT